jgi:hypothetical protein
MNDAEFNRFKAASAKTAILSACGIGLVIGSMVFAYFKLANLERQKNSSNQQVTDLSNKVNSQTNLLVPLLQDCVFSFSEDGQFGVHLAAPSNTLDMIDKVQYTFSRQDINQPNKTITTSDRRRYFIAYYKAAGPDPNIAVKITFKDPSLTPLSFQVDAQKGLFKQKR